MCEEGTDGGEHKVGPLPELDPKATAVLPTSGPSLTPLELPQWGCSKYISSSYSTATLPDPFWTAPPFFFLVFKGLTVSELSLSEPQRPHFVYLISDFLVFKGSTVIDSRE